MNTNLFRYFAELKSDAATLRCNAALVYRHFKKNPLYEFLRYYSRQRRLGENSHDG